MSEPKAISFRVEWDDGTIWAAEGDTATAVMKWYTSCEIMAAIHGAAYKGPHVTVTRERQEENAQQ